MRYGPSVFSGTLRGLRRRSGRSSAGGRRCLFFGEACPEDDLLMVVKWPATGDCHKCSTTSNIDEAKPLSSTPPAPPSRFLRLSEYQTGSRRSCRSARNVNTRKSGFFTTKGFMQGHSPFEEN